MYCVSPPDEAVEQEDGTAYDPCGTGLLVLRAGQGQPIVHVTLVVHDGLKQTHCHVLQTLRKNGRGFLTRLALTLLA